MTKPFASLILWHYNLLLHHGLITDSSSGIKIKVYSHKKHTNKYQTAYQRLSILSKLRIAHVLKKSYDNYYFKLSWLLGRYFLRKGEEAWLEWLKKRELFSEPSSRFSETEPSTLINSSPSIEKLLSKEELNKLKQL